MLLYSVHILANLALKETVPPQPQTSPHVTGNESILFWVWSLAQTVIR